MKAHVRMCEKLELEEKQVNILISKNLVLQILYLKDHAYKTS